MTLAEAKAAARAAAFVRRKAAHGRGSDAAAQAHLARAIEGRAGQVLAGYSPMRTEIDPLPVMARWSRTGPVAVPVIAGKGLPLVFHRWTPEGRMIDGPFGARVPEVADPLTPQVLIVPLVAFDARGMRLGYGGGFYDRTLEALRRHCPVLAVGFAYEAQLADDLPLEATDQPLDAIATEAGLRWFSAPR